LPSKGSKFSYEYLMKVILGIETSCDETAAAVVAADRTILSNVVFSQFSDHARFGGVVPEIAARAHLSAINWVVDKALSDANVKGADLAGVAATAGPGLIGGVMVGLMTGKALAAAWNKPFIGVNHLEGHALSPRLSHNVAFPYLLLLVSGGHSQILLCKAVGDYRLIGSTVDDAAGECFDKTAKLLGLPQPGGPALEALAREAKNPARFGLPRPLLGKKTLDFSFSGLKTAVRERIESCAKDGNIARADAADLAAALQTTIAGHLADRCAKALDLVSGRTAERLREPQSEAQKITALVAAGGVASNSAVRAALEAAAQKAGVPFMAPPSALCTDNGAMIAWAGFEHLQLGHTSPLDIPARPRWPLDENPIQRIN
jgi:N6-L-threonylcarbamoyladenine synthase